MRETSTPPLVEIQQYKNVTDLVIERQQAKPNLPAFERPTVQGSVTTWVEVTISEFLDHAKTLAKGMIALGVVPRENIVIMAETSYEWAVVETATWLAGAVVVPIYDTSSPQQVQAILDDCTPALMFGGSAQHTKTLANASSRAATYGMLTDLDGIRELGEAITDDQLETRRLVANQTDVATIVYTSGTTGDPKGALITHQNLIGQVLNIAAAYTEIIYEGGRTIIFLPLAHVLARGLQLVCLTSGMKIAHLADPKKVIPALAQLRPTFLVVVPRILQKIQAAAGKAARDKHLGWVWKQAEDTAIEWSIHLEQGTSPGLALKVKHRLFSALFYKRLRTLMGNEIEYLLSGAAALEPQLALFFRGIGVPVVEGYGLTETTAPLTGNLPGSERAGSVGTPTPGSTVRISEQGEVLAKGVGVFAGYKNPQHNETAFEDGYFKTGDLGELDSEGRLTLKGRIKDVIVTSGGKTVTPAAWENMIEGHPLVAHAIAVGEGKPYLSSVILVDPEALTSWAAEEGEDDIIALGSKNLDGLLEIDNEKLRAVIANAISSANNQVSRSEQIRRFTLLLADLSNTGGNITATMKLKRQVFLGKIGSVVERIYSESPTHSKA